MATRPEKEAEAMNRLVSDDDIKVLAVTMFDNQNVENILACENGSSLIKMKIINSNIKQIPFQTIVFAQGRVTSIDSDCTTILIDLDIENNRFLSIKEYQKYETSFTDIEFIPELSDTKPSPNSDFFKDLSFSLIKKHANILRVIKHQILRQDYILMPKYIKGAAFITLYETLKVMQYTYNYF